MDMTAYMNITIQLVWLYSYNHTSCMLKSKTVMDLSAILIIIYSNLHKTLNIFNNSSNLKFCLISEAAHGLTMPTYNPLIHERNYLFVYFYQFCSGQTQLREKF